MPSPLRLLPPLLLLLVSPVRPRDETVLYKGREYMFRDAMRPFDEVQAWCHQEGGYLPSVNSSEDMIFLNKFAGSERHKWLGATRATIDGSWQWDDGSVWSFFPTTVCHSHNGSIHLVTNSRAESTGAGCVSDPATGYYGVCVFPERGNSTLSADCDGYTGGYTDLDLPIISRKDSTIILLVTAGAAALAAIAAMTGCALATIRLFSNRKVKEEPAISSNGIIREVLDVANLDQASSDARIRVEDDF